MNELELDLSAMFNEASTDTSGTSPLISPTTSAAILGNMGSVVVAGAAGKAAEDIEATSVTLVTVILDNSGSMHSHRQAVVDGMNQLRETFLHSKEKDSVLLATWTFGEKVQVNHSYIPVADTDPLTLADYPADEGATALYAGWCDALAANIAYAQNLRSSGTDVRSIVVVLTDGENNVRDRTAAACAQISQDLLRSEQFILAFVGLGYGDFRRIAQSMGVPDGCTYTAGQVTESELRKVFRMVSQSVIRASQGKITPGANAGFFSGV